MNTEMPILDHEQNRQIMTQKCFDNKTRMIVWTRIKKRVFASESARVCLCVSLCSQELALSVGKKFADQAALQGQSGDHTHIATHLPINTHTFKRAHTHTHTHTVFLRQTYASCHQHACAVHLHL